MGPDTVLPRILLQNIEIFVADWSIDYIFVPEQDAFCGEYYRTEGDSPIPLEPAPNERKPLGEGQAERESKRFGTPTAHGTPGQIFTRRLDTLLPPPTVTELRGSGFSRRAGISAEGSRCVHAF